MVGRYSVCGNFFSVPAPGLHLLLFIYIKSSFINRLNNVNWPPYTQGLKKADVSSMGSLSEKIKELWVVYGLHRENGATVYRIGGNVVTGNTRINLLNEKHLSILC